MGVMKTILDSLRNIAELLRLTRKDVEDGQGRLAEAEQRVAETMALLEARRDNIALGTKKPVGGKKS